MVATVSSRHGAGLFMCIIYSMQQSYKVLSLFDGDTEAQEGYLSKSRQLVNGGAGILI